MTTRGPEFSSILPAAAERLGMLGIGELVLLFLVFLFTGGALSRLAGWAFFRRAPGARQILSVLLDRVKGRRSAYPLASAAIDILSGSPKSIDESPSRTEAGENEEPPTTPKEP